MSTTTNAIPSTYVNPKQSTLPNHMLAPAPPNVVIDNSMGRVLQVGQNIVSLRLISGETGGAYSMVEQTVQPGDGPPLHIHLQSDETYYVLASEFEFQCGQNTYRVSPGGFIFLPRCQEHSFRNIQRLMGRLLVITSPGGMEAFWKEIADLPAGKTIPHQKMSELYHRHGMELLESLPHTMGR